jgi:hypothetical protein
MKNSYQVIAGQHISGGKTYKKGDSVVSDQDLVKMYHGKFRLEGPVKEKAKKAKPAPVEIEDQDDEETETETETLPPTKPEAVAKKKAAKVSKGKDKDWDD